MKKNQGLIDELNKELEAELEKEPAQMDTEKIREINKIIARLEGQTKLPERLEKSKFFKEFDRKYGYSPEKEEKYIITFSRRKLQFVKKAVAACAVLCILFLAGNAISVSAVDKSLFEIFQETAHSLKYMVYESQESDTQIEEFTGEPVAFSSWKEAKEQVSCSLLDFEYMPENFTLEQGEIYDFGSLCRISAYFTDGELYVNVSAQYGDAAGTGTIGTDGDTEKKKIGEREVYFTDGENKSVIFEEQEVMYSIDSNLDSEELIKIVENMK